MSLFSELSEMDSDDKMALGVTGCVGCTCLTGCLMVATVIVLLFVGLVGWLVKVIPGWWS